MERPGMQTESLTGSRIIVTDDEIAGFRISIEHPRRWAMMILFSVWLVGWAGGETAAILTFVTGHPYMKGGPSIFLLFWLVIWTIGGFNAVFAWLWSFAGREAILIDDRAMVVRREAGPWRETSTLGLEGISDLRLSPLEEMSSLWSQERNDRLMGLGGSIACVCHRQTYRFGVGLSEPEAKQVIGAISERIKCARGSTLKQPT